MQTTTYSCLESTHHCWIIQLLEVKPESWVGWFLWIVQTCLTSHHHQKSSSPCSVYVPVYSKYLFFQIIQRVVRLTALWRCSFFQNIFTALHSFHGVYQKRLFTVFFQEPCKFPDFHKTCTDSCHGSVTIQCQNTVGMILFCGFYRCVNWGESLTNCVKPEGLYVKFVSDSPEFTHR